MDRRIIFSAIALLLMCAFAVLMQLKAPVAKSLTPTLTHKPELCLTCHDGLEEISPSHPVQAFGCVICHGGNALALDKDLAHSGMRGGKNPSDFSVVEASCGGAQCHSGLAADHNDHLQRSMTSIQGTYAGAIAQCAARLARSPTTLRITAFMPLRTITSFLPKLCPHWQYSILPPRMIRSPLRTSTITVSLVT